MVTNRNIFPFRQMFGEHLSADDEQKESQGFFELMHEQGRKLLPLNLPEETWHIMSPAAMAPKDMPEFYDKLSKAAPYTFELMVWHTLHVHMQAYRLTAAD